MHVPKEHDNLHWGKWLPREIYVQENGETTHLYSIRAKKDAELERQQAIALDAGNSQLDPSVFPRRTVKELNEVGSPFLPDFCLLKRDRNADVESAPGLHSSRLVYFTRDCSFLTTHQNAFELETWHELYIAERELIFHKNLETWVYIVLPPPRLTSVHGQPEGFRAHREQENSGCAALPHHCPALPRLQQGSDPNHAHR
jgi:hypothetical protein